MSGAVTRERVERWVRIEAAASVWVDATDLKAAAMAAGDSDAYLHAEILREKADTALRAALRGVSRAEPRAGTGCAGSRGGSR